MSDLITVSRSQIDAIQGALVLGVLGTKVLASLNTGSKTHFAVLIARDFTSLENGMGAAINGHATFRREVIQFLGAFFDENFNHLPQCGSMWEMVEHGSTTLFEHMITALNFWNMLMSACTVHMNSHCRFNGIHDWFEFPITFDVRDLETGIVAPATHLIHGLVV